jgi:hypothetical protein
MVDIKKGNDLENIRIRVLQTAEDYLYHDKTPKYATFFSKWATRTVEGDYLKDLIESEISSVARTMLLDQVVTQNPNYIWYWKGYAAGVLRVSEVIISKSQKKVESKIIDGETDEDDVIG